MTSTELTSLTTLFQTTNSPAEHVQYALQQLEAGMNDHYTVTGFPPRITPLQPPLPFALPSAPVNTTFNLPATTLVPTINEMISDHEDSFEFTTEDWLGDSIGQSSRKKSQATSDSSKSCRRLNIISAPYPIKSTHKPKYKSAHK
ncbi:hypothetical protein FIBSPDRAFT_967932 [Athelia psychrophila]|uniref:Uncharacterized protein n=1 Tax=Athelia psychrophila TaxID=1759441 RepID=A0A167V618_9AGAM|nr:hypothetical protein FIBSPDRAFT_967932 [Fibularhizoctonia sp. CBS 109695]